MKSLPCFSAYLAGLLSLAGLYHLHVPPTPARPPGAPFVAAGSSDGSHRSEPLTAAAAETTIVLADPPVPNLSLSEQIAQSLRAGSAVERDRALHHLLPRLIATDATAAGRLVLAWEPGATRDELLRQVTHYWSETDIANALSWAVSLGEPADAALAAATATAEVAQSDPAGALDLAQVLRIGLDDGSFEHRAQIWTEDDPSAAVDWVKSQPAGALRDRLLARIAWVRAQREPAEAADLVLNHMRPGETQTEALMATVRHWAVREPAEAAEWIEHFPAGTLRERAAAEIAWAARRR